jgi:hypothetical protein
MQVTFAAGKKITTIEGLARGDRLHPGAGETPITGIALR